MKKFILSAIIIAGTAFTAAAQVRTAYFVESTTYRSQFNPAFAPTQGYVNFPLVARGGLNFNLDGTMSVNDFIMKRPSDGKLATILSSEFDEKTALKGLNKFNNSFNFNTNINLLGFGNYFKDHKSFWSVDMNLHIETALDIPYSFFQFAKTLSGGSKTYDFSKFQVFAQSYLDLGFNYSRPIMDNLYVGARAKFLVGLAHANAKLSQFNLDFGEDMWKAQAQAEMNLYFSGINGVNGESIDKMSLRAEDIKGPSGYGFAVDLGAYYSPIENLTVSLAVNDIGFISWGNSVRYETSKQGIEFSGVDMTVTGDGTETKQTELSFDEMNFTCTDSRSRTTSLRATINAGVEYEMWDHWVGFGLLYHARMGLYKSSHNITASVNFHPRYWFTLSPSYTFNNNRGGALGLALNFAPRGFNLFVATDLLLSKLAKNYYIPYKQDRMTFTFGMGFNIGRRSYRVAEYAALWQAKEQKKQERAEAMANARAAGKAAKSAANASSAKVTSK